MSVADSPSSLGSHLIRGYLIGTLAAAFALHIAVAIIAPGDAGTLSALQGGPIFVVMLIGIGAIGLLAFPLVAAASWPMRRLALEKPVFAFLSAIGIGAALGYSFTAFKFQLGPGDYWSGSVVGTTYAFVWFFVVRQGTRSHLHD